MTVDEDEYITSENDPQKVETVTDEEVADIEAILAIDEEVVARGSKIIKKHRTKETPAGFLFAKKKTEY